MRPSVSPSNIEIGFSIHVGTNLTDGLTQSRTKSNLELQKICCKLRSLQVQVHVFLRDLQIRLLIRLVFSDVSSPAILHRLIRQFLKVTSIWPAPAPGGPSSSPCCQSPLVQGSMWVWLWPSLPTCPRTTNGKGDYRKADYPSNLAEPS